MLNFWRNGLRWFLHLVSSIIYALPGIRPRMNSHLVVSFFPVLNSLEELVDLFHKAHFFLPNEKIKLVQIYVGTPLWEQIQTVQLLPGADYLEVFPLCKNNIRLNPCPRPIPLLKVLLQSDYIFVWDWDQVSSNWLSHLFYPKLRNVDRHTNIWDGWTWAGFDYSLWAKTDLQQLWDDAQKEFQDYLIGLPPYRKVYVFGTGPSLEQAYQYDFSDGYRVVCNTIVKNERLLEHIQPHFIVAADAIYHFGNTKHAYQFRLDLEKALEKTQARFITADIYYPLLKIYNPIIQRKTLPARTDQTKVYLDMKREFGYTSLGNILNVLLLPLGTSLSDEIYLLGFDGRGPNDFLFWKNSVANSYEDLKPSIMASHPAFFSKMNYSEYAQKQSDDAEELMELGEKMGKRYFCLNKTYIPAFKKRQIY